MTTIIYCHPYAKSFNHAMLEEITKQYTALGREYYVIDLYADGFDSTMHENDLALYSKGESIDPLVKSYQEVLLKTKELVFIFPIWWGMMPSMLLGFIDKVFLKGTIYDTTPEGALMPCLSIDKTTIITTSQAPSEMFAPFIKGYFTPMVLNTVGIDNVEWYNCDKTAHGPESHRKEFVDTILSALVK